VLVIVLSAVIYKKFYKLNDEFREEVALAIAQKLEAQPLAELAEIGRE